MTALSDAQVGDALPAQSFRVHRADLVRYAGASGDFNPIHWNERAATSVGLPNVIAHGMYTMAVVARVVTGLGRRSGRRCGVWCAVHSPGCRPGSERCPPGGRRHGRG